MHLGPQARCDEGKEQVEARLVGVRARVRARARARVRDRVRARARVRGSRCASTWLGLGIGLGLGLGVGLGDGRAVVGRPDVFVEGEQLLVGPGSGQGY